MEVAVLITCQRPHVQLGQRLHLRQHQMDSEPTSSKQFIPAPAGLGGGYPSAAPPTADQRQAKYFVRLLTLRLRRIDDRIDKCRRAIAFSTAAGDIDNVIGFRGLL